VIYFILFIKLLPSFIIVAILICYHFISRNFISNPNFEFAKDFNLKKKETNSTHLDKDLYFKFLLFKIKKWKNGQPKIPIKCK
jgi:hypothetical protein